MDTYRPPLDDIRFCLTHEVPLARLAAEPALAAADADTVAGLLEEAGRFAAEVIAPTDRIGDREGARLVDGGVVLPDELRSAYARYVEAGWGTVQHPEAYGGGGFPLLVATAVKELVTSANMAFSLGPLLTTGAVHLLTHHGSDEQRARWLPRMVTGEWTGTMNLTEPQAGSDLGAVTTRAEPTADGSHRIFGQKIYITYGDHDLTDQVVHLVLARLPDAPPGTKGISLFIVPKRMVTEDGSLGAPNDVRVVSIEHKLGIHASPTCVMAFGEGGDGAWAELVGAPHDGMRQMFTMMNDARLGVGLQGLAVVERALQRAEAYARERTQGRGVGTPPGTSSPIVVHPDVRRKLLEARAQVDAMRALCYANAHALDLAQHAGDADERARQQGLADLLTPLSKAWCTDLGVELTSEALQVFGGMGYVEETGVAQQFRDARIAPIYEGTNGIQAIDLVGRKLPMEDGGLVARVLDELVADLADAPPAVADLVAPVVEAAALARDLAAELLAMRDDPRDALAGATPYLRVLATTVATALVVRGLVAAERARAAGEAVDAALRAARTARARVLVRRVLPRVHGLAPAVRAGAADLYAEGTPVG
jgi:alkylation response protein AidB-like acyl-CoA dehydrogenase